MGGISGFEGVFLYKPVADPLLGLEDAPCHGSI